MPLDVMLLVLFGAALHAGWNALVKSSPDKFADTVLVAAGSGALAAIALPFLPLPAPAAWPFALASGAIHIAYFSLVAAAYRLGDMGIAYPLMRGTAPLLVALLSGALIGEDPGLGTWAGVLLVSGGVLALALDHRRPRGAAVAAMAGQGRSVAFALLNALVIATYTIVDGMGARASGHPVAYTLWILLMTAVPLSALALLQRGGGALLGSLRARWPVALIGGGCTLGAYALALWAMTRAPIAAVAALRETSILFGMALAALVLKERTGPARLTAGAAIAAGAVALRLG